MWSGSDSAPRGSQAQKCITILLLDVPANEIKVDRAHRLPKPPIFQNTAQCDSRIHFYHVKEQLIQLFRKYNPLPDPYAHFTVYGWPVTVHHFSLLPKPSETIAWSINGVALQNWLSPRRGGLSTSIHWQTDFILWRNGGYYHQVSRPLPPPHLSGQDLQTGNLPPADDGYD